MSEFCFRFVSEELTQMMKKANTMFLKLFLKKSVNHSFCLSKKSELLRFIIFRERCLQKIIRLHVS